MIYETYLLSSARFLAINDADYGRKSRPKNENKSEIISTNAWIIRIYGEIIAADSLRRTRKYRKTPA